MKKHSVCLLLLLVVVYCQTNSHAGTIIGGSNLLDYSDISKLEAWLNEGPLKLTNIFDYKSGDAKSSIDFHSSVDGKGRTFVVIRATDDNVTSDVGGYDSQSWRSDGGFNFGYDMTGFLFNLDSSMVYRPSPNYFSGLVHAIYNPHLGPTYGAGYDLAVLESLNTGYSYLWTYGENAGISIVSRQSYDGYNMLISNIEVFSISNCEANIATPEPSTMLLMGIGLAGAVFMRRRAKRS
ncbi:MAG: hypothetical protein FD177_2721 [Desulfovibrionaceae bacterium]|nr:MAG: hypothetical protein FD177_2721 [Desulfovibrionaceae bacterium]